jgi:hypothetical protein
MLFSQYTPNFNPTPSSYRIMPVLLSTKMLAKTIKDDKLRLCVSGSTAHIGGFGLLLKGKGGGAELAAFEGPAPADKVAFFGGGGGGFFCAAAAATDPVCKPEVEG